jgi:RimJ/RimL family protein N-acetyltransferase
VGQNEMASWHSSADHSNTEVRCASKSAKLGFAGEATSALPDHCFATLGTHRVEAHIEPDNAASIRAAERPGCRREGRTCDRVFVAHQPRDMLLYALLRPDWSKPT